jgi:hypothetical protein
MLVLMAVTLLGTQQARGDPPSLPPADPAPRVAPSVPVSPFVKRPPPVVAPGPPPSADEVKDQYLRRLKRDFDVADVNHSGSLTLAQANAAGLSLVSRHFDAIDTQHTGSVTFDQVSNFLRGQDTKP